MSKHSVFARNEVEANKALSFGSLFCAIILAILYVCYVTGVFVVANMKSIHFVFPFNILLLLSPLIFIHTKKIENRGYKYYVIACYMLLVFMVNVFMPKHGILGWAVIIAVANHYYSPKVTRISFIISLILMAICMPLGMMFGEWDANLMGIMESDFANLWFTNPDIILPNGGKSVNDYVDRIAFLNQFNKYSTSLNRWAAAYLFYYLGRAVILLIVYWFSVSLAKRTHKLIAREGEIEVEQGKLSAEMSVASDIQESSMPKDFPSGGRYDIYASMTPAKEVGGDFYDYVISGDTITCVIADVSGKGVPAAMFMMKARTLIRTLLKNGASLGKTLDYVNKELCENNDNGMFVTCLIGQINLSTGESTIINAGHNPFLTQPRNGNFEYKKEKNTFVLGGFENIEFHEIHERIEPGTKIFIYTDGITEAFNEAGEQYGEERLRNILNSLPANVTAKEAVDSVQEDVMKFRGKSEQSDDMTSLCLIYNGDQTYREIDVKCALNQQEIIVNQYNQDLETHGVDRKVITQINIAIDELFSNIVNYGFKNTKKEKHIVFRYKINDDSKSTVFQFSDNGIKFNPLETEDPDVTLSAEERQIGGLGIFIVKKSMDNINYEYKNGRNIVTVRKDYGK